MDMENIVTFSLRILTINFARPTKMSEDEVRRRLRVSSNNSFAIVNGTSGPVVSNLKLVHTFTSCVHYDVQSIDCRCIFNCSDQHFLKYQIQPISVEI